MQTPRFRVRHISLRSLSRSLQAGARAPMFDGTGPCPAYFSTNIRHSDFVQYTFPARPEARMDSLFNFLW